MKYIFKSQLTEDLLHNWETKSIDIKAGFFFHHRGNALQKSFEGVLRSLIIQVLQPHRNAFQKQYQKTWENFQPLKQKRDRIKKIIDSIIEKRKLLSSGKDLEAQLQRAKDDSESEAKGDQIVIGLNQKLSEVRKKMKEMENLYPDLRESESDLRLKLSQLRADMADVSQSISPLAKEARPFRTQPETGFLRSVVAEFGNYSKPHRLERTLNRLLDQDIKKINLVLFFDALDEFDGHLDTLSGFLKNLVERSAKTKTRIKACFSSRPWQSLSDHFAKYPGFRLQEHTMADIEQYATGSLARSELINSSQRDKIMKIIPSVITRANGVFLWVRLALKELLDTVAATTEAELFGQLTKKLEDLPIDLLEFYELIIARISQANRRYTFALLELLARHAGPPATATDIWGAVLTSNCTTFQESLDALQCQGVTASNWDRKMANDISTWGGGLVEIKKHNHVQLMHQTVLEFIMNLRFKKLVMGDVAAILNENGHSFYLKYWVAKTSLRRLSPTTNNTELWITAAKSRYLTLGEQQEERKLAAHHAEESESTTGLSQLDYIDSVPITDLKRLIQTCPPTYDDNTAFLAFASSYGLTLCINDWIARNPDELQRISLQRAQVPLLTSLVFEPASGVFHERCLTIAGLLLKHGYRIAKDTQLFPRLLKKVWTAETEAVIQGDFSENDAQVAILPIMQELAILLLDHGQDPNIIMTLEDRIKCTPLHVASPGLAAELIRCNAGVNIADSIGKTPLDWVLEPPRYLPRLSCARRYEMCCLLVVAGGLMSPSTPAKAWRDALAEFDSKGYNTQVLRSKDTVLQTNFKNPFRYFF